jgi:hypothetical protein
MATATLTPAPPPGGPPQRRFTVAEYHKLMEIGLIRADDRCELVRGLIVEKPRTNPPHATAVTRLTRRFLALAGDAMTVRVQLPITLSDSEPEPDVVLAAGTDDDYTDAHPGPRDVRLLIEVSDASLADDQGTKLALYAAAKLPAYWVVNIPGRRVEVYTQPRGGKNPGYKQQTNYGPGDEVPVVVGGTELGRIPVDELLP